MDKLKVFEQFAPKLEVATTQRNAVIYTRVSHSSQEDNTSLEAQRKRCEEYASANGYTVVEYFGGTHESAKTDDRKEFNRMLTFVKRNKRVNFILVYSYERFSRTGADGIKIAQDLQKQYKVTTLSVSQGIDPSTITGEFQRNIMLLFGHLDNQMRKDKTISGMRELVEKGFTPYSIPRGYVNLNKGKAVNQKIVVNDEGKLLRKAFIWKAEKQMRNCEIIKRLKAMGLKLNDKQISTIFANPYYCGVIVSKLLPGQVIQGKHEPMISPEVFLKINGIIAESRTHPVSHKEQDENLPLKRFALCSECGTPLTGYIVRHRSGKSSQWYYKCRTKGCKNTKSAKQLHEQFKTLLSAFQINDSEIELIRVGVSEMYRAAFDEENENQRLYKGRLKELQAKLDAAEENVLTGVASREIFDKFAPKFQKEIEEIQSKLVNFENESSNLEKRLNKVIEFCRKPLVWWEKSGLAEKMILQNIIFPSGIIYDRKKDRVLTQTVNEYFAPIPQLVRELRGNKKGENTDFSTFPLRVTPEGF